MNYEEWIKGERRIRMKILNDSPVIQERKAYRVCKGCGEVCLCHEGDCPNCNSSNITEHQLTNLDKDVKKLIRCQFRFKHLAL